MPTPRPETHIGDRGTLYRLPCIDQDGAAVDPTDAVVAKIIFKLPQGDISKDAIVVPIGSPATSWELQYRAVEGEGLGSPAGEFHVSSGRMSLQARLEWADGTRFSSNIAQVDDSGRELRVARNIQSLNDDLEFED